VSASVDIDLPPDAVLVRTSGVCSACDVRFTDELAYEFRAPDAAGRVLHVEQRHFGALAPARPR
jgi:hypothetical protein